MPRGGDRRSKSARLKKIEGNRRKVSRATLDAQVKAEPKGRGAPKLPLHLTAAERLEFAHVLESAPASLLTGADQALIENYAVAISAAREAHSKLQAGKLVQGANGPVVNPFWRIWRQSVELSRMLGSELGLSPASRARIKADPVHDADPMEMLLGMDGDEDDAWATSSRKAN